MRVSTIAVATALAAGFFVTSASAQDVPSTADGRGDAAASAADEAIVVTARRRSESLQNVPTAIVAFDQRSLERKAIVNAYDLGKVTPGLSTTSDSGNPSLPSFSIRGRGQNFGAATGSVETYFADVPLSAPFQMPQLPAQFFDVQSIQVLKGPQGTLFGRNTTGGAVVIVPHEPTKELGGYFRGQLGNYGDVQGEGAINVPLIEDKALLRVSGFYWTRNGYGHTLGGRPNDINPSQILPSQSFNNQNTKEIRAILKLMPVAGITNTTILTYHYDKVRATAGAGYNLLGPAAVPGSVALPAVAGQPTLYESPYFGTRTIDTFVDLNKPATRVFAAIDTATITLADKLTLKNIFGYITSSGFTNDATDGDGTILTFIDLPLPQHKRRNAQITDEIQLQGSALDSHLKYTLGALYDHTYEPGGLNNIPSASLTVTGGSPAAPATLAYNARYQQNRITSKSVYISGTYDITDMLSASGGFRYTRDKVFAKQGFVGSNVTLPPDPTAADLSSLSKTFSGATYNADLTYKISRENMVYAGYRHGYKRGGFNSSIPDPVLAQFGKETVNDFFVGSKNQFEIGGMRATLNAEAFYDRYKGQQVSYLSIQPSPFAIIAPTINVPATDYKGVDVDFSLNPAKWLDVSGSYTYLDTKNKNWKDPTPGSNIDLSPNRVIYAPKNKYSLTVRLHADLPNREGELALSPTISHQDKLYAAPFNTVLPLINQVITGLVTGAPGPVNLNAASLGAAIIPGSTTIDLRLEFNHAFGSNIDLAAQATNLTNKYYLVGVSPTIGVGVQPNAFSAPRMFYLEAKVHF